MIVVSLISLIAIVSSQAHKQSGCWKLESAFDSLCPSQIERSTVVPLQGRPGKMGPRGPAAEKGRQGIKGERGSPGEADYESVEVMISRMIQEVLDNQTRRFSDLSNLLSEANERIENLEKMGALFVGGCENVDIDSALSRNETGGVYRMWIPGIGSKEVYCDLATDGGNWTVFQRRMDGSINFNRKWNDYAHGFGMANGEFWLGLGAMHQLTRNGNHELRIDMIEYNTGTHYYAKYSDFKVGAPTDFYRLKLSGFSGNISDSFAASHSLNNQQFSTFDQDHDSHSINCASTYEGGWWFRGCIHTHLNGLFEDRRAGQGVNWYDTTCCHRHMRFTEMKLRQKN